jgi:hypothetical protein
MCWGNFLSNYRADAFPLKETDVSERVDIFAGKLQTWSDEQVGINDPALTQLKYA